MVRLNTVRRCHRDTECHNTVRRRNTECRSMVHPAIHSPVIHSSRTDLPTECQYSLPVLVVNSHHVPQDNR